MNTAEIIFGAALGALIGTAGANFLLRLRLMKIEHELWGVRGNNGMKSVLTAVVDRVDRILERERRAKNQYLEEEDA